MAVSHVFQVMRLVPLALTLAGCAANLADSVEGDVASDFDRKLGAAHGVEAEHVEYEMKLAGMTVGRFQIAVGKRGVVDGRRAVAVHSHASLAGAGTLLGNVDWDLTTTVDIDSGFAIEQTEEITVDVLTHRRQELSTTKWTIADRHHNAHSAAGALRGWVTAPGAYDEVEVSLIDTTVPVTITDAAHVRLGNTPAVRYDGRLRDKYAFSVWLSDDVGRVPLRLHSATKVGDVDVAMVSYDVAGD